jgi:hypothetical protein
LSGGAFSGLLHTDLGMFLVTNSEQKKGFSNFADGEELMKISRSEFSNKEKNNRETYPICNRNSRTFAQYLGGSDRGPC